MNAVSDRQLFKEWKQRQNRRIKRSRWFVNKIVTQIRSLPVILGAIEAGVDRRLRGDSPPLANRDVLVERPHLPIFPQSNWGSTIPNSPLLVLMYKEIGWGNRLPTEEALVHINLGYPLRSTPDYALTSWAHIGRRPFSARQSSFAWNASIWTTRSLILGRPSQSGLHTLDQLDRWDGLVSLPLPDPNLWWQRRSFHSLFPLGMRRWWSPASSSGVPKAEIEWK